MRPDAARRRGLYAGAVILVALAAAAVAGPTWAPDPDRVRLGAVLAAPGPGHWLGTDGLGRDVASRLLHGGRISLTVGLVAAALAVAIGVPVGALAGYRGGLADRVISRAMEAVLCFPTLVLALALLAAAPDAFRAAPPALRVASVVGLTGWASVARYLRAETLRLRSSEMIASARASGANGPRIVLRHVLPSALAPALVTAAFAVGSAILLEAALSFLGLGVAPPTATWGGMLEEARQHPGHAWWLVVFPGLALFATVLGCNLVGEGIRDRLDAGSSAR